MKFWSQHFEQPILRKYGLVTILLIIPFLLLVTRLPLSDTIASLAFESLILLGLVWFFLVNQHRQILREFFGSSIAPFKWGELIALLVALILVTYSLDSFFALLLAQAAPDYVQESLQLEVIELENPWWANVSAVLLAAVIAPAVEEVVFRGLLFSRLSARWSILKAVLVSSLLFGLLHIDGFFGSALFGACMCLVYYHSRNLWLPIGLHIANNAIAVAWLFIDDSSSDPLVALHHNWPYYLATLLAAPVLYLLFKKYPLVKDQTT